MKNLIILAGGKSSRFQESFPNVHKMLLPWKNQLWIDDFLDTAVNIHKFEKIYFSLGCYSEQIINYINSSIYSDLIEYFIEPDTLGTGGGIMQTMDFFKLDNTFVMNCDSLFYGPLDQLFNFDLDNEHDSNQSLACIGLVECKDTFRFGRVTAYNNRIKTFNEKNIRGQGLINSGIYKLKKQIFNPLKNKKNFSIELDIFQDTRLCQSIACVCLNGKFVDIGTPDDYFLQKSLN